MPAWFKYECEKISAGLEMPDILDLSEKQKDDLVSCWLLQQGEVLKAANYRMASNERKNDIYQQYEGDIRSAIDKFNENRLKTESVVDSDIDQFDFENIYDEDRKEKFSIYQDMIDAGHKMSDFR